MYNTNRKKFDVLVEKRYDKDHSEVSVKAIPGSKQPTIADVLVEMRAGFKRIDARLDRNNLLP